MIKSKTLSSVGTATLILASGIAAAGGPHQKEFKVSVDKGRFELGSQANVTIELFPIKLGPPLPNRPGHLPKGYSSPKASLIACLTDSTTVPPTAFLEGAATTQSCGSDATLTQVSEVPVDALASGQSPRFTFDKSVPLPTLTGPTSPKPYIWIVASIEAAYPPEQIVTRKHAWIGLTEHCEGGKDRASIVHCAYWTNTAWAITRVGPNTRGNPPGP